MKGFLFTIGMSLILGILKLTVLPLLSWYMVALPVLLMVSALCVIVVIFLITYTVMVSVDLIHKHWEQ